MEVVRGGAESRGQSQEIGQQEGKARVASEGV